MKNVMANLFTAKRDSVARAFRRYGWLAFWIQVILAAFTLILSVYVMFFSNAANFWQGGLGFSEYLSLFSFLILLFTIFWAWRYTRLAPKIADEETCPPKESIVRTLWIGLWAACLGIFLSMATMVAEVLRLLFLLLRAPQGGVPVIQTDTENQSFISAIDMVSLLAELMVLAAELVVLALTLWLLLRTMSASGLGKKKK